MSMLDLQPVRIGAPKVWAARPLIHALSDVPGVCVVHESLDQLQEGLRAGEIDAALLPPLYALQTGAVRLIPGIGVASSAHRLSDLESVRVLLECPEYPLTSAPGWCPAVDAENVLPVVLWVWACRSRAPYPRLRQLLAQAQQQGLAQLTMLAQAAAEDTGIPAAAAEMCFREWLYYRIGSAEADRLRCIAEEGVRTGLLPPGAAIEFC